MSGTVRYCRSRSTVAQVIEHLTRCDAEFAPFLSSRVQIDSYAAKIVAHAERFEAWSGEELVGLLAAYLNDAAKTTAFVTNVSVLPSCQGRGTAVALLQACIDYARSEGFVELALEVGAANRRAISLYEKSGFIAGNRVGDQVPMTLKLERESSGRKEKLQH